MPLLRLKLALDRRKHRKLFCGRQLPIADALALLEAARQQNKEMAVDNIKTASTGKALHNPYLAHVLASEDLGTWALDAATLDFLEREIKTKRPQAILEFGSGISTVCFARYLQEAGGSPLSPCLFSIEQNAWQVEKSQKQLEALGLAQFVRILHAPLAAQWIEGVSTECYALPARLLESFLGDVRPDWIFVDGPCGNELVRFGTLPLIKDYAAKQASFYLDDALRSEETQVARLWSRLPYIHDMRLHYRGKGLWTGKIA